jgi:hypothetical protein
MVDLGLVVAGAKAAAAVVAQLQAGGGAGLNGSEAVQDRLAKQVGGGPAVHPGRGVDPCLAGAVVDDREHRAAPVMTRPGLGRISRPQLVRGVGGDAAVVQAPAAAADLGRRRQQAVLAHQPQHPLAAGADPAPPEPGGQLLVAFADERRLGDLAADRVQQLEVG